MRIAAVERRPIRVEDWDTAGGGAMLIPSDPDETPFFVDAEFVAKHNPRAGGYYAVGDDGSVSFVDD